MEIKRHKMGSQNLEKKVADKRWMPEDFFEGKALIPVTGLKKNMDKYNEGIDQDAYQGLDGKSRRYLQLAKVYALCAYNGTAALLAGGALCYCISKIFD